MPAIILRPSLVRDFNELKDFQSTCLTPKQLPKRNRARASRLILCCSVLILMAVSRLPLMAQSSIAATMTSPATGSILPGASATFSWTAGSGVSAYQLYVGTVWNQASNIYNSGSIEATSATVTGLPDNGVFVYVTLFSEINSVWQPTHYTFTASGSPTLAVLISPTSGSTLPGSSATFSWTPGSGVSCYSLYVGTTWIQADNLFASGGTTATSVTVNNLPTDGVIVYATLFSESNGVWHAVQYSFMASGTPVPPAMISPAPGSVLPGSPVTFSWSPGAGPTEYFLSVGTTGAGASNLVSSGVVYGTSFTVSSLPTSGTAVYATLSFEINGAWQAVHYTYIEASPALPTAVSCGNASMTGSGIDSCTVTLSGAAPGGGLAVNLLSSSSAVVLPAVVTVPAGASSAVFAAAVSAVGSAQTATLTATANGASTAFSLQLNAAIPTLSMSSSALSFGNVVVNTPAAQSLTFTSTGSVAVTINSATLAGTGFTMSGTSFPVTLSPNQAATLSVVFDPASAGTAAGTLAISSNSSTGASTAISLSGTGMATLSAISCGATSFTGPGSDSCTATLNTAAPSGGASVTLASSNSAVTVPASVTVAAGASSAPFTATVASVGTTQTATLSGSEGGASSTATLQLNAAASTLSLSAASVTFGNVTVNTAVSQTLTLSSTGNMPVTVNSAAPSGTGFTVSGASFPMTLNPSQTATLTVQFDPTAAGTATGTLTISSNSSTGALTAISLSGSGMAVVSALSCSDASITGSGSDSCTATLNTAAPAGGVSVALASSNSAVTLPASVTVPAGAASASFAATVSSVATAQTATLSASEGGASTTFSLQLNASIPTLTLSSASIGFGGVTLNTPETQSLTLTSSGNAAVTVSSATLSGAGFSLSPATFPITLNPGQAISLALEFDPSTAGAATGQLTIAGNSSTGATMVVNLTGTGNAPSYQVDLSWEAPSSPDDPIAGYNVYRATSGSTMYQLLNSSTDSGTSYVDTTVQAGLTYDYYVETIDDLGVASVPSSTIALAIT